MSRIIMMLSLIFVGETVFSLPFNVPLFFRPTVLEVFGVSNTQLGDMFAVYGVAAMLAYFPGGALADYFSARTLIVTSLFLTAIGGLYMATFPGVTEMRFLYGYWGVTTVFLFWGAFIKATREWGGDRSQGLAFGLVEGGRGVVAASAASIGVFILAVYMPEDARFATPLERESGLRMVVWYYTLLVFLTAVFAWFAIPAMKTVREVTFNPIKKMSVVLSRPIIWAQAAIIVSAYCMYKGLGNYSLYAVQVLGMDEVEGARLASYGAWTRPVAALIAGLIADRFTAIRSIVVMFGILCISYGLWSLAVPSDSGNFIIYANFFTTYAAVYALRAVYFALLEENHTPMHLTGVAVGLVSVVGYTPDVFFAPITGRILDANPGLVGFQHYFLLNSIIAALGVIAAVSLILLKRGDAAHWKDTIAEAK